MSEYDASDNSIRCFELGLAAWREREIRAGRIEPLTEQEHRWAASGPVPNSKLETVRNG